MESAGAGSDPWRLVGRGPPLALPMLLVCLFCSSSFGRYAKLLACLAPRFADSLGCAVLVQRPPSAASSSRGVRGSALVWVLDALGEADLHPTEPRGSCEPRVCQMWVKTNGTILG